jgi:branched-chain amino acid aminotransferase
VAEDSGEKLLLVRDNTIYTTPHATILEGITRDTVVSLARDAGYAIIEERISREQLYDSDELLVCSTAAELLPVREIDFHPIGSGGAGPVTRKLQNLFSETIKGHNRRSVEWLDYMVLEPVI